MDLTGPRLDRAGERFAAIARENRPKCVHPRPIAILRSVDKNQMLVLALANVPTIITVLIGILLNNGRINDLNSRFSSMETRFTGLERKFENLDHKFDTRFDLLLSKVVDLDNRLTRIEAQRH